MFSQHSTTLGRLAQRPRRMVTTGALLVVVLVAAFVSHVRQPGAVAQEALVIKALTEKRVTSMPAGSLVWRIETFPTVAAARAAEGPLGLVAESTGQIWLLTLG